MALGKGGECRIYFVGHICELMFVSKFDTKKSRVSMKHAS